MRRKSGKKYPNALAWYHLILKKAKFPGMELWAEKTMQKCVARLKKYGIKIPA